MQSILAPASAEAWQTREAILCPGQLWGPLTQQVWPKLLRKAGLSVSGDRNMGI